MSSRTARRIAFGVFALYLVALVWPGVVPFNRVYPLILGLPFSMAWYALWIVLGCLALVLVERTRRAELEEEDRTGSPPPRSVSTGRPVDDPSTSPGEA